MAKEKHLERITVDALMDFRATAFCSMASSFGRGVDASIGVNGVGQFVIKSKGESFTYNNPATAIEKYTELITK